MQQDPQTPLSPTEATRWTRIGVLSALAMLLGYLESFVPIPLPGVKLGLANIPVLVALAQGDARGAFFVGVTKVIATSLLFGNPVTFCYSAVGTLLAFCVMAPLSRLKTMRIQMVSVVGALAHEAGQLLVAQALLGTPLVWYSAPVMAISGCVTGLLCGAVANRLAQIMAEQESSATDARPDAPVPQAEETPDGQPAASGPEALPNTESVSVKTVALVVAYLAFVAFAMHTRALSALVVCLALALLACLASGVSMRSLLAALLPAVPLTAITAVAQIANNQHGPLVAAIGPVAITQPALAMTAVMVARLVGITIASVAFVRLVGTGQLAACARAAVAPLRALGVCTQGPELALSTTLRLLPLLHDAVKQAGELGPSVLSRSFWLDRLPQIAADLYQRLLEQVRVR